jgi:FKBP-type peptidyl-prolyl cis-trans isomerase FklB
MKRIATALALTMLVPLSFAWAQQPQPQVQPRPAQPAQQPAAQPAQAQPQRSAATAPTTANPVRPEQVPAGGAPKAVPGLASDKQKFSYGVGLSIGGDMRGQLLTPDDLDLQALFRGLSDALADGKPALTRDELRSAMSDYQAKLGPQIQERVKAANEKAKALGEKNLKEGQAFLTANKTKEGVKTTASGLQYKVMKSGNGPSPTAKDSVSVKYKGSLIDGTVFDSSDFHPDLRPFEVGHVIPGWTEALQLMKVGDKWQLFVPAELAYGAQPESPDIPPNAVLLFEVELLGVEKGAAGQLPLLK